MTFKPYQAAFVALCFYLSVAVLYADPSLRGALKKVTVQYDGTQAIAKTKDEYISLNIEFFKQTFPILNEPKVQFLMSQLQPAYLRIGGNSADSTVYNVSEEWGKACVQQDCFSIAELQTLQDFASSINWKLIFNLNQYFPYPDPGQYSTYLNSIRLVIKLIYPSSPCNPYFIRPSNTRKLSLFFKFVILCQCIITALSFFSLVIDPDTGPRTPRPGPMNFSNNYALMEYMAANDLAPTLFTLGNELTDNISPTVAADDYNILAKAVSEIWPNENKRPG